MVQVNKCIHVFVCQSNGNCVIFQKNDALLKEIEQLKEQYVIKFQEVSGKIDKCTFKVGVFL